MDVGRLGMDSAGSVSTLMQSALTMGSFWGSTGPVLAVALLIVLVHAAGASAWGRRLAAVGRGVAEFEGWLRQWRTAGSLLLVILLTLGWTAL
jgi:hypothetical protein